MSDEHTEDTDWDSLLEEYAPETEQEEVKLDEYLTKLTKNQRKLAEKQAAMEAQSERDKLVGEFYEKADENAKQFADVLLAGVSEPDKVKKLLELASAKAAALSPEGESKDESEDEEANVESAFSPPVANQPMSPKDPRKELAERTKQGDMHAAFIEFMDLPAEGGPLSND